MTENTQNQTAETTPVEVPFWVLSSVFLAAFAFLLMGLNPTFFLDDSAETITASYFLGVAHPPGYPLTTLLGRLFAYWTTGGTAFRVNLLSAVLAAAVSMVLVRTLARRMGTPLVFAVVLGMFWPLGATVYSEALSAKGSVYQLSALLVSLIIAALMGRRLYLAAFLWGLSMANHWMTMVVLSPGLLVLAHACRRDGDWNPKALWTAASLALTGMSLYLFIPIRAVANPPLNWGDSQTWSNFLFNFSRAQYRGADATGGLKEWSAQAFHFLKTGFLEHVGLLAVAALGVWVLRRKSPRWALGLGLMWIGLGLSIALYLDLAKDHFYLIDAYAVPSHLISLLFAGSAVAWGLKRPPLNRRPFVFAISLLFLTAVGVSLGFARFHSDRQTHYTHDYDYAVNVMRSSPRNALLYCKGDGLVFPTWYLQYLEGRRPDLAAIGVDGLPMIWVRQRMKIDHPDLKVPMPTWKVGLEAIPGMKRAIAYENPGRPLFLSYNKIDDASFPEARLLPYGIASQAVLPPQTVVFNEGLADYLWATMRIRNLTTGPMDARTRDNLLKDYAINRNALGVFYEDAADLLKVPRKGQSPPTRETLDDLYGKCLAHFQWSQKFFADDGQFPFNVGNALYHLGRKQEATVWYRRSVALLPDFLDAKFNWAVAAFESGDYPNAGRLFQEVLDKDPTRQGAKDGLEYLKAVGFIQQPKIDNQIQ